MTLHPDLQRVLDEAIKHRDFTLICGHRNEHDQNEAFASGRSKLKYPASKHNKIPSEAVDLAPWFKDPPHIRWDKIEEFASLTGFIMGIAASMGIMLRSGGDWDGDGDHHDQSFMDWPHLELL